MECIATPGFVAWLDELKDLAGRARIQARIERLRMGHPGQHRVLTGGVCEMKIDAGPGYRVYYTRRGTQLMICWRVATRAPRRETSGLPLNCARACSS